MRDLCEEQILNPTRPTKARPLAIRGPLRHLPPWGALLEAFCARAGLPLPNLKKIKGEDIPLPYRKLLVHSMDMTPTLEAFYRQTLGLTVLSRLQEGECYLREVVLHLAGTGRRVGYGAIRIFLTHLPPASANRVLDEQVPFGSILQSDGIPHLSWPQDFFRAQPDVHMQQVLGMSQARRLYGRRNVLLDGGRRLLAEVVEVLAPIPEPGGDSPTARALPPANGAPDTDSEL